MKNIRLLLISPGPHYWLDSVWGWRLNEMSAWAEGAVVSTTTDSSVRSIGSFELAMVHSVSGKGLMVSLKLMLRIIALAWSNKYDLVVTYDPLKSGLLGLLASRLASCPLVVEVNGVYTSPYVYSGLSPFKVSIRKWLMPKIMAFTLGKASGIKLLFDTQIDVFKGRLKNPVIRRFPDIVYTERFHNIEDKKEILCIGHPFHLKGMDILVRAFLSISDRHPDWTLKLLGWFVDQEEVKGCTGNHPRILVHKAVPVDEVPEHIGRCGIFVLPSRTEAMGRVLVEAMAAGKARIGANVDGIPTVIEDGVDGMLFASQDVDSLASCLEKLITNDDLRRMLGQAGAARALREFTPQIYLANARQFYLDVLSAGRR